MAENKNAVIVGKVNLPPRREVVIEKKQARPPRQEQPRQERKVKRDDPFAAKNANQQMLQELQFIKGKLKKATEDLAAVVARHDAAGLATANLVAYLAAEPAQDAARSALIDTLIEACLKV